MASVRKKTKFGSYARYKKFVKDLKNEVIHGFFTFHKVNT
jgi:hypothetical protein